MVEFVGGGQSLGNQLSDEPQVGWINNHHSGKRILEQTQVLILPNDDQADE